MQRTPRRVKALDGHRVTSYGQTTLPVVATDNQGITREVTQPLEVVDLDVFDVILGYPWLREVNPMVDWPSMTWAYKEGRIGEKVAVIGEKKVERALRKGCTIYVAFASLADDGTIHVGQTHTTCGEGPKPPAAMRPEYADYGDVASEENASTLPAHQDHDHVIELQPGTQPPHRPIYNLSEKELEVLREYLESAMNKGWIRPSTSPAGAPILFVPKKDGALRLCVDYRGLNAITQRNRYPLPLVTEIMDRLSNAKVYTKLDLRDAYHRIRIKEGQEWMTAFRTRYGHFEYTVMPFGLVNAPASFQSYVHRALSNLLDICCVVYLDDILIYSNSEEEHVKHVREVLDRLRKFRLYIKLSKCEFHTRRVGYLGFIVTPEGIEMEQDRVASIEDWPEPENPREILMFTGFANFYRRFIEGYSRITLPLTELTREEKRGETAVQPKKKGTPRAGRNKQPRRNPSPNKIEKKEVKKRHNAFLDKKFKLPEKAKEAFNKLKEAFTEAPLLRHFDPRLRIRVETDASGYAISGIISQLQEDDGQWHPVAFWSRKMIDAERRYEAHDGELLAIVEAFKHWRHYLEGSRYPVVVKSDHANLRSFMEPKMKRLNGRQARWAEMLTAFDFIIEHRPGIKNPADAPSRRPDYEPEEGDTFDGTLLPTLQAKLTRGLIKPEEWNNVPSEFNEINGGMMTRSRAVKKDEDKMNVDEANTRRMDRNAPADENHTNGDTEILDNLVPRALVRESIGPETAYSDLVEPMTEFLKCMQTKDHEAKRLRERTQARAAEAPRDSVWSIDPKGLLRFEGRAYVPRIPAVKQEIMKVNHDDPTGGHTAYARTLENIRRKYFWHNMNDEVRKYVNTCDTCQRIKVHRHAPYGKLQPLPIPEGPADLMSMDFITGLPASKHGGQTYDAILVVVDAYTKYTLYLPCRKDIKAPELAQLMIDRVFPIMGAPQNMVSDRGSLFTGSYWSTLCHYLGTRRRLSTAYHPQTDGATERMNQEVQYYLRAYVGFHQDDWARWLSLAQWKYNASKHSVIQMTPAEALMGFNPDLRTNVEEEPPEGNAPSAKQRIDELRDNRTLMEELMVKAKEAMAKQYDRRHKEKSFRIGDEVYLRAKNIKTVRPNVKLDHRQLGPFVVIDVIGTQSYKLQLPQRYQQLHPVFHVSLLEPCHIREGETRRPPAIPLETEDEYQVDRVLTERRRYNRTSYLVSWVGYSEEEATWEPYQNVRKTKAFGDYLRAKKKSEPHAKGVNQETLTDSEDISDSDPSETEEAKV